jgi:hypothetical protein
MEKRIIAKVSSYMDGFHQTLLSELQKVQSGESTVDQTMEFIQTYHHSILEKNDFIKRKRTKNCVPADDRCVAKRANNEQCSRRKKDKCLYCGTHSKGIPHGVMNTEEQQYTKKEVWAEDIRGIIYYIDDDHKVYKNEDIMKNLVNPTVIGTWSKLGEVYTIHRNT